MVSDLIVLATSNVWTWLASKILLLLLYRNTVFYPRTISLPLSKLMSGAVGLKLKLNNSKNRNLLSQTKTSNQTQKLI